MRLSEKSLKTVKEQLTLAHRRYQAEAEPVITKMAAYFRGQQWPAAPLVGTDNLGLPRVVHNLIFSDVKVILPAIALRNPKVYVKPTAATTVDPRTGTAVQIVNGQAVPIVAAAAAKEALANWRWRELRLVQQVRRCLLDALLAPFAIMKVGYTMSTEKVEPTSGEELEVNELIEANAPFALRWSPADFRVDPKARYADLSDAEWIAFGSTRRLEDVKRDPKYKNTKSLKGTEPMKTQFDTLKVGGSSAAAPSTPWASVGTLEGLSETRDVRLWEVWDTRRHAVITVAEDHDPVLQSDDWPLAYDWFPAETLVMTEYPDTLYGVPDLWHVLWPQDSYNELSSMILNHVLRFVRKYAVRRGTLDETELQKLEAPVDGVILQIDAEDVNAAISPIKDAAVPGDWWNARTIFRDDHDRISGMGEFLRGVAEKVDTATEASLIQANMSVRVNDTRALVEDFAVRVTRQLLQIDAQTLDVPAIIPVVGPDGALALGQFAQVQTRETLQAETDVEVEIGSMQPVNELQRKSDTLQMYALWRNDPLIDQFKLRQRVAAAFHGTLPDLDRLILPPEQFARVAQQLQGGGMAPPGGPGPSGAPPMPMPAAPPAPPVGVM